MLLKEAYIEGFGKYEYKQFNFQPGLNVLYGENESGKTTLIKFILHMLYGMKRPGLKRKVYLDEYEQYFPWSGYRFGGTLVYETDKGIFKIERDFIKEKESLKIFDIGIGSDITKNFPIDERREVLFAMEQVGVTDDLFKMALIVSPFSYSFYQNETRRLALYKDIHSRLIERQQLDDDSSLSNALGVLEKALNAVGTERAKSKPLGITAKQLDDLQEKSRQIERFHEEILNLEREMSIKLSEIAQLNSEIQRYELIEMLNKKSEIEKKLRDLHSASSHLDKCILKLDDMGIHINGPLNNVAELSQSLNLLHHYSEQYRDVEQDITILVQETDNIMGGIEKLPENNLSISQAYELVDEYHEYQEIRQRISNEESQVDIIHNNIQDIDKKLIDYQPYINDTSIIEKIEAIESKIKSFEEEETMTQLEELDQYKKAAIIKKNKQTMLLIASGAGFIISAIFGYIIHYILWALLPISSIGAFFIWKKICACRKEISEINEQIERQEKLFFSREAEKQQVQQYIKELFTATGLDSLGGIKERAIYAKQLLCELQQEQQMLSGIQNRLDGEYVKGQQIKTKIIDGLQRMGIKDVNVDTLAVREFYRIIENYKEQVNRNHKYHENMKELEAKRHIAEETYLKLKQQQQECASTLNTEQWFDSQQLSSGQVDMIELLNLIRDYDYYTNSLESLTQGQTINQTKAKLESELGKMSDFNVEDYDIQLGENIDINVIIKETEKKLSRAQGQKMVIESKLKDYHIQMEEYEGIDDELYQLRNEYDGLVKRKDAIEIAIFTLKSVSMDFHKEFIPNIISNMKGFLSFITNQKYQDISINESLDIKHVQPLTNRMERLDILSSGTQDQFFFAFQVALAEILIPQPNLFFLLDDPFIQYDEGRKAQAMELMNILAQRHQVLYFTCHKEDIDELKQNNNAINVISLT